MSEAPHAGFAAVIAVAEAAMQGLLRVLYVGNKIPHTLNANSPILTPDGGSGQLIADLSVGLPTIRFRASAGDRYLLQLRAWGWLFVTGSGLGSEGRNVELTATVSVPPALSFDARGRMSFGIDGAAATLDGDPVVEVTDGPPFPAPVQAFLDGALFRLGLEVALRDQLASQPSAPLSLEFLGSLVTLAPQKTATPRVLDGVLLVGVDVGWVSETVVDPLLGVLPTPVYPEEAESTEGDATRLRDFRRGYDVGYWINPRQLPIVFLEALGAARREIESQGATLESLALRARDGALHVSGRGSTSEGTATFSFDVVPRLTTSIFPWEEVLVFQQENARVDVDLAGWLQFVQILGGIVTLGALALGVDRLLDALRGSLERQLGERSTAGPRRNQQFTLPGTRKPPIDLRIEAYRVRREGVFSALTLTPRLREPSLTGASRVYRKDAGTRAEIAYSVRLPPDVLADDPRVAVRWTLRRDDDGTVADQVDGPTTRYNVRLDLPGQLAASDLRLSCRVYRARGARADELYNGSVRLREDTLDAAFPYVRWRHKVPVPRVRVEEDDSLTFLGEPLLSRRSRIHRTDLPGRCLFAGQYSDLAEPEYLAELPFPKSELPRFRRVLCDYCFFGGPTLQTPLI